MQPVGRGVIGGSNSRPKGPIRTALQSTTPESPSVAARRRFQMTEELRQEIRETFEHFDLDTDGLIDEREMWCCMRALGSKVKRDEIPNLMQDCAARNQNGQPLMDLPGFTDIMTEDYESRDPIEEITQAFYLFDVNKTGKISLQALRRVAQELGENMSDKELQAMIDEFDTDRDGKISLEEFLAIMLEEDVY